MKRGTTEECLRHYSSTLGEPGAKNVDLTRRPAADFCGVSSRTIQRWAAGHMLPVGITLIKLRFFLGLVGYRVSEIEELAGPARKLFEMMAVDVVSLDKTRDTLGYKNEQDVYRVVIYGGGFLNDKAELINLLWEENSEYVSLAKEEWLKRLEKPPEDEKFLLEENPSETSSVVSSQESVSPRESSRVERVSSSLPTPKVFLGVNRRNHSLEINTVSYLILAMLPLAERVASDEFTPEERKLIRELTGDEGVFRLSNALNQMCGEDAREDVRKKSHRRQQQ